MRHGKGLFILLILTSLIVSAAGTVTAVGTIKNEDTGETFGTIQNAIDHTNTDNGDTIIVNSGKYVENININKEITLKGNNTGGGAPIINGNQDASTVVINTDNVEVTGFKITNSSFSHNGIYIESNDNLTIYNNTITDNGDGVFFNSSSNNNVTNNNITGNNYAGVELVESSDDNIITDNKITDNSNNGLNGVQLSS